MQSRNVNNILDHGRLNLVFVNLSEPHRIVEAARPTICLSRKCVLLGLLIVFPRKFMVTCIRITLGAYPEVNPCFFCSSGSSSCCQGAAALWAEMRAPHPSGAPPGPLKPRAAYTRAPSPDETRDMRDRPSPCCRGAAKGMACMSSAARAQLNNRR